MTRHSFAVCAALLVVLGCRSCHAGDAISHGRKMLDTTAPAWGQCGGESCSWGNCKNAATLACPAGYGCTAQSEWYWQCLPGASSVPVSQTSPSPAPVVQTPSPSPSPSPSPTPAPTTKPSPSPAPVTTTSPSPASSSGSTCTVQLANYAQCGGTSNCASCVDATWPGACCGPDSNGASYSCQRQNEWYWQCQPGGSPSTPVTTTPSPVSNPSPASTPASTPAATSKPTSSPVTVTPTTPTTPATGSSGYQKPYSYLPNGNYLTTVNDQIIDQNGNTVKLHGIAWFGFGEASSAMVEGLTTGSDSQTLDFSTVVRRMKALGFNTIKLPFSFNSLLSTSYGQYTKGCAIASDATIMSNLIEPSVSVANGASFPSVTSPGGSCNSYLPSNPMDRFNWVINYFTLNGFYVVPDWHPGVPQANQEIYDPTSWVANMINWYKKLVTDYPGVVGKLIVDLINEPDTYDIKWEVNGNKPALRPLYLNLMDVLFQINAGVPFMLQGTGQAALANWGDGFITDAKTLATYSGMSDPNLFFQQLLAKPYLRQVILGPHVYGPSVTQVTNGPNSGWALWSRLSLSFGTKSKAGYCDSTGKCNQFAICLGEYGSSFTNQGDLDLHRDMTAYLHNTGESATGDHNAVVSWIFWSWNPSSSDTGGLVGTNWLSVQWNKVDKLVDGLNLKPWYYGP